jgi:AcrR family transcriptional regulator
VGRDQVRSAILDAATSRFAAEGTGASLRDIATDAGVNLGLIHRHFGNKDDLLRAVVQHHVETGSTSIAAAPDIATAIRDIFEGSTRDGLYVRIMAWLLLESAGEIRYQQDYPGMAALRALAARDDARNGEDSDDRDARLMTAMATVYGWTVFGPQILAAFERDGTGDRRLVESQLVRMLEEIVTAPAAHAPRPAR